MVLVAGTLNGVIAGETDIIRPTEPYWSFTEQNELVDQGQNFLKAREEFLRHPAFEICESLGCSDDYHYLRTFKKRQLIPFEMHEQFQFEYVKYAGLSSSLFHRTYYSVGYNQDVFRLSLVHIRN